MPPAAPASAPASDPASARADAEAAWRAGLLAVSPEPCVRRVLSSRPDLDPSSPRTLVIAVGKAAAGMMLGALPVARGFVLLPAGAEVPAFPPSVELLFGGHPHPTAEGLRSTRRLLEAVSALGAGDRLLVLLSGGTSALLEAPAEGVDFDDLVSVHRALVASGAPIAAINLVRSGLSAVKAGRLAAAAGAAAVTTLAISDVEGDDPAVIGSGPTVATSVDPQAIGRVLREFGVELPERVAASFAAAGGRATGEGASVEAGSGKAGPWAVGVEDAGPVAASPRVLDYTVIAAIGDAVEAARLELERRGYRTEVDPDYLRGDTASAASRLVSSTVLAVAGSSGRRAWVTGGETTVALGAVRGRGGRNLDLASRLALAIAGRDDVVVVSAGTDGRDGSSLAAGAIVDGATAARAAAAGHPLDAALAAFDTEPALESSGDLLVTGPTGTNVGDLVLVLFPR